MHIPFSVRTRALALVTGAGFLVLTALLVLTFFVHRPVALVSAPYAAAASTVESQTPQELQASLAAANLPLAQVALKSVPHAKGTVLYIPQVHFNPASNPTDSINDTAVTAQGQIKDLVSYLTQDEGAPFVMVEGTNYGPVATTTLSVLGQKLQAIQSLKDVLDTLPTQCSAAACTQALADAQALEQKMAREAILEGGAQSAKAAGGTFALVGAEDPTTELAAGNVVRQYFYLNDRLAQLTPQQTTSPQLTFLAQMLQDTSNTPPADVSAADLASLNGAVSPTVLRALSAAVSLAHTAESAGAALLNEDRATLPARSDNPYASETSTAQLESQLAQVNNEMQNTVVDARNSTAAANFAKGLADEHTTTGVLVFGAGHTAGLIKDLNQQGLNVVVLVPTALAGDQELAEALAS